MGNCLVVEENSRICRVMKADGEEVLECKVLGEKVTEQELEDRNQSMVRRLLKNPEVRVEQEDGAVRIKLVISRKELEAMLRKGGGGVSVINQAVNHRQKGENYSETDGDDYHGDGADDNCGKCRRGGVWKPNLESIPEGDY